MKENEYLVVNWDDIINYLNNSEKRSLAMMIKKVDMQRAKEGKDVRDYAVMHKALVTIKPDKVAPKMYKDTTEAVEPVVKVQTGSGDKVVNKPKPIKKKKFKSAGVVNVKDKD